MQHMAAGATAGMGEHLAMFPVDTVKTRMQALAHPGQQASLSFFSLFHCALLYLAVNLTNSIPISIFCSYIPPFLEQCRQF